MTPLEHYSRKDDIISVNFGKVKHSRELKNVNIVVDFDKDDNIVGVEIFDFMEALGESQKIIDRIFKKKPKYKMSRSYKNIKQIKTKKVPVVLNFTRKDGTIVKMKATKCVIDNK